MSTVIKSPYEISIWQDYYDHGELKEKKIMVIGSNTMTSQNRAINPKLVSNVNGTNTFTFSMYYRYKDTETGEEVENSFTTYLANETKVKLHYKGRWYDFIVKNITKSSDNYIYNYTLTDLYINELSKTGFNITLATELENNIGDVASLAREVLKDTDWVVGNSDVIAQLNTEILFKLTLDQAINATLLTKGSNGAINIGENTTISSGETIYGFYSCCSSKDSRFQFIYMGSNTPQIDSERVILNGEQYYIENVSYIDSTKYGVGFPTFVFNGLGGGAPSLDGNYRGEKFVFTQKSKKDVVLDRIVKEYKKQDIDPQTDEPVLNTYYGYTDTQYITPNLLTDYVSNGSEFKNSSGWRAGWYGENTLDSSKIPTIEVTTAPSIQSKLSQGSVLSGTYTPVLKLLRSAVDVNNHYVVVNSGLNDSKRILKTLQKGEKFVCYLVLSDEQGTSTQVVLPTGFNVRLVKYEGYNATTRKYNNVSTLAIFNRGDFVASGEDNGYYAKKPIIIGITEADLKKSTVKLGIVLEWASTAPIFLKDFQLFKYYEANSSSDTPILPKDQQVESKAVTTYYYYKADQEVTKPEDIVYSDKTNVPLPEYLPSYAEGCAKQKMVSASQSNRFNIIQSLCEAFECWAAFEINHDSNGYIIPFDSTDENDHGKRVVFYNYIGKDNPVDFIYGINLKSIQRTVDSKQLVTKLIVKANSNQYAPNGMCTIARAAANPTGETTIYNFDYYVNQGMLSASELEKDLYLDDAQQGYMGYYVKLAVLNKQMREISNKLASIQLPLAQARADVQEYEAGAEAANEKLAELNDTLTLNYGKSWYEIVTADPTSEIYQRMVGSNPDTKLVDYVVAGTEYNSKKGDYETKLAAAKVTLETYEASKLSLESQLKTYTEAKETLNISFFKKYARFIQEGTWNDESYTDENLYFYDAQSVAYDSSIPAVTYTISLIDVSPIEGYEVFEYQLGDRTYVQDTEFFGYVEVNGAKVPARESVIITELTYSLDQPENNSIKVQTYKNQFQDLFHRMSATVQQVKLTTGAYNRAAALAEADVAYKVAYLQDALNDASTVLENNADQTVVWDNNGITITNNLNRAQVLRLISGGILLSDDGGETWKLGITAEGISANKITSGQVDTSVIQIMHGDEAYFRWDAFGITAYDFDLNAVNPYYINGLNTHKGVRFDRFGIYSFTEVDGANWHPGNIEEIRQYSIFDLTNEGLHVNLGKGSNFLKSGKPDVPENRIYHNSESFLGRTNGLIYNQWTEQTPGWVNNSTYTEFVKIISVINNNIEQFALYDDGTLFAQKAFITGTINAGSGTIGGWFISNNSLYKDYTDNGTKYSGLSSGTYAFFAGSTNSIGDNNATFYVTRSGTLHAINAEIEGIIRSESGSIGGFTIDTNKLYSSYTILGIDYYVGLQNNDNTSTTKLIFAGATANDGTDAVFYVRQDGAMYATSGQIAGFTIENDKLYGIYQTAGGADRFTGLQNVAGGASKLIFAGATANDGTDAVFYVARNGYIYAQQGAIGAWHILPTKLYSRFEYDGVARTTELIANAEELMPSLMLGGIPMPIAIAAGRKEEETINAWNSTTEYHVGDKVKYDPRQCGYLTIWICTSDCRNIAPDYSSSYWESSTKGYFRDFMVLQDGSAYIMYIQTKNIQAISNKNKNEWIQIGELELNDYDPWAAGYHPAMGIYSKDYITDKNLIFDLSTQSYIPEVLKDEGNFVLTKGNLLIYKKNTNSDRFYYAFIDPNQISLGYNSINNPQGIYNEITIGPTNISVDNTTSSDRFKVSGYWYFYSQPTWGSSDRRLKNSISTLSINYNTFFDDLSPVKYRLNFETENKFHIGFIAQDVLSSLKKSGLDADDFAGYIELKDEKGDIILNLQYTEFISLNTWQIQLLKSRISELEQKLFTLEAKLNALQN